MKVLILKLLALVGLAPATHVAQARAQARHAADKTAGLEDRLAKLREDRDSWKQRYRDATSALGELKKTAGRAEEHVTHAKADAARARAQADEWRTRAEALTTQVRELRDRLEESRRLGTLAREHLMATEVKLDLIEAAIQVLDTRTREAAVERS